MTKIELNKLLNTCIIIDKNNTIKIDSTKVFLAFEKNIERTNKSLIKQLRDLKIEFTLKIDNIIRENQTI